MSVKMKQDYKKTKADTAAAKIEQHCSIASQTAIKGKGISTTLSRRVPSSSVGWIAGNNI